MNPDCVVFDAMRLLNEMNTKKFKTGNDLLNEFLRRIDVISSNAQIRIVSFDTYRESSSLKDSTRIARKKRSIPPRHFSICLETDIERVSMSELLASNTTKKSLTELLMPQVIKHMKEQNADYVVAGNCKTYWSLNGQIDEEENDHEEADSLMIRCLKLANDVMTTNIVKVYSSDTDVFLLLLSHSDKINCQSLFICLVRRCCHQVLV